MKVQLTPSGQVPAIQQTQPIAVKALQEIRTIQESLQAAISVMIQAADTQYPDAAALITPAVERLAAIATENHFPE